MLDVLWENVLHGGSLAGENATVFGWVVAVGEHEDLGLIVILCFEEGKGLGGSIQGVVAGVEHNWIRNTICRV